MQNMDFPKYNKCLEKVLNRINESLDDCLSIESLASTCGYSPFHFQRIFKSYVGENVAEYIQRLRIEKSAFMLKYQYKKISTVAMRTGFNSNSSFTRVFKNHYNMSPMEFKSNYKKYDDSLETPNFKIVKIDNFKVFFVRTLGNYKISEPLACTKVKECFNESIDDMTKYVSICYDEPTISTNCNKLRYEACIIYNEKKHKKLKGITLKKIESGYYAKFEFTGTLQEFDSFFYKIYDTFYHNKNYQISLKPAIQIHHNPFDKLLFGITKTDLLIPID